MPSDRTQRGLSSRFSICLFHSLVNSMPPPNELRCGAHVHDLRDIAADNEHFRACAGSAPMRAVQNCQFWIGVSGPITIKSSRVVRSRFSCPASSLRSTAEDLFGRACNAYLQSGVSYVTDGFRR
jgi:hypothetical protein